MGLRVTPRNTNRGRDLRVERRTPQGLFIRRQINSNLLLTNLPPTRGNTTTLVNRGSNSILLLLRVLQHRSFLISTKRRGAINMGDTRLFRRIRNRTPTPKPNTIRGTSMKIRTRALGDHYTIKNRGQVDRKRRNVNIIRQQATTSTYREGVVILLRSRQVGTIRVPLYHLTLRTTGLIRIITLLSRKRHHHRLDTNTFRLFRQRPLKIITNNPFRRPTNIVSFTRSRVTHVRATLYLTIYSTMLNLPRRSITPLFTCDPNRGTTLQTRGTRVSPRTNKFTRRNETYTKVTTRTRILSTQRKRPIIQTNRRSDLSRIAPSNEISTAIAI